MNEYEIEMDPCASMYQIFFLKYCLNGRLSVIFQAETEWAHTGAGLRKCFVSVSMCK